MTPPYDPNHYVVTEVQGHQITAKRHGKTITRDAQKWKAFTPREKPNYEQRRIDNSVDESGSDDEAGLDEERRTPNATPTSNSEMGEASAENPEQQQMQTVTAQERPDSHQTLAPRRNPPRSRKPI